MNLEDMDVDCAYRPCGVCGPGGVLTVGDR